VRRSPFPRPDVLCPHDNQSRHRGHPGHPVTRGRILTRDQLLPNTTKDHGEGITAEEKQDKCRGRWSVLLGVGSGNLTASGLLTNAELGALDRLEQTEQLAAVDNPPFVSSSRYPTPDGTA
jgi:hypothetical protein